MNESEFHRLADTMLNTLFSALEEGDKDGTLDVEYQTGAITIETLSGKIYIISKHAPSQQLWLSSPVSGGLHFRYDEKQNDWVLADARTLSGVLAHELQLKMVS